MSGNTIIIKDLRQMKDEELIEYLNFVNSNFKTLEVAIAIHANANYDLPSSNELFLRMVHDNLYEDFQVNKQRFELRIIELISFNKNCTDEEAYKIYYKLRAKSKNADYSEFINNLIKEIHKGE